MIFHSIRWRVQAWHGLILVLVLAAFGFTAYHVARDNQLRRIDQDLGQRFMALFRPPPPLERHFERAPGPPPESEPQPSSERPHVLRRFDFDAFLARIQETIQQNAQQTAGIESGQTNAYYYVLWGQNGSVLARSPATPAGVVFPERFSSAKDAASQAAEDSGPWGMRHKGPVPPAAWTRGQYREAFSFLPGGECVLVGRSIAPDLAAMHRLAFWLIIAGAGVLVLGLAGGWWVASRAIRPIEDISATAMKIAAGDLSQRINAADTESELGRLAGILNSTFGRLEAAFAHQARFTSDASHELRTPVAVILSKTQTVLSRQRAPGEYREALETCQRAAQRMRSLTESLLALAHIDAGQEPLKREKFDLSRVARDSVELVRPLAVERGIELHCDLPAVECVGDPDRIGQVATNLLTNAIQFNRERGEVRVRAKAENGAASLIVTDSGQGIPAEDLPHIFERFYRVDKSRSRVQGSTGLGLAICKAVADAHGGVIEVSSQPGSGSTFRLILPEFCSFPL